MTLDDRDLERRLTTALQRRALDIQATPHYLTDTACDPTPTVRIEPGWNAPRRPRRRAPIAVAALLLLAVVVTMLLSIRARDRSAPAAPIVNGIIYGERCQVTAPSGFNTVVARGTLPSGPADATVLAGDSDGALLIEQTNSRGTASAVDILAPNGRVTTAWRAAAGEQVRVIADPNGSLNTNGAAFETVPIGGGQASVWQFDLPDHLTRIQTNPGYTPQTSGALPLYVGDDSYTADFVERSITHTEQQAIPFYLAYTSTPVSLQPVSNVVQLLTAGGVLVIVEQPPGGQTRIITTYTSPPGGALPTAAAGGGSGFVSDRTALRWLRNNADRHDVYAWSPANTDAQSTPVIWNVGSDPIAIIGPYLARHTNHGQQLLNLRTGGVLSLPTSITLIRVDGPDATLALTSGQHTTLSRLPLTQMPTPRC